MFPLWGLQALLTPPSDTSLQPDTGSFVPVSSEMFSLLAAHLSSRYFRTPSEIVSRFRWFFVEDRTIVHPMGCRIRTLHLHEIPGIPHSVLYKYGMAVTFLAAGVAYCTQVLSEIHLCVFSFSLNSTFMKYLKETNGDGVNTAQLLLVIFCHIFFWLNIVHSRCAFMVCCQN